MVSSIGQSNTLQSFTAINTFRNTNRKPEAEQAPQIEESSKGIELQESESLLDKINVAELRKCATAVGEYNITDEDIKYGLTYGRSVIAEFIA